MTGTLYVVATPIGNLEDITKRAVRILEEVDCIAAEDTRRTRQLLTHLGIRNQLTSYHGHNEDRKTSSILDMVQQGKSVALVSDAGTPGISDPGYRIVRAAQEAGLTIVPIPGPSAIVTALSAAGLPNARFTFVGFLPEKRGKRQKLVEPLAELPHTLVFYLARWDVQKYMPELQAWLGDREAVVCRELTKQFEEFRRGPLSALAEWADGKEVKGEITLLVMGKT